MKKLFVLMIAALALSLGSCRITDTAQAKEGSISSQGSMIYRQDGTQTALYAEDLLLLKDKLDTISEDVFDPVCYTHMVPQEPTLEPDVVNVDEPNICWDYESMEEEEAENAPALQEPAEEDQPEIEGGEDATAPQEPAEGDQSETEGGEDATAPQEPAEGDQSETEGGEDVTAPQEPAEEDQPETEGGEDALAPTEPAEGNLPETKEGEDALVPSDSFEENLPEVGDTEEMPEAISNE